MVLWLPQLVGGLLGAPVGEDALQPDVLLVGDLAGWPQSLPHGDSSFQEGASPSPVLSLWLFQR